MLHSTLRRRSLALVLGTGLALIISLAGCTVEEACPEVDQVQVLEEGIAVGTKSYTLVRRVSGAHDKVELFELYETAPDFDSCGRTELRPVAVEAYDQEQGYPKALVLDGEVLTLRYTESKAEAVATTELTLDVE